MKLLDFGHSHSKCIQTIYYKVIINWFSFAVPSCFINPTCSGEPLNVSLTFSECCLNYAGVSYDLDGRCQPCPPTSEYSLIIYVSKHTCTRKYNLSPPYVCV